MELILPKWVCEELSKRTNRSLQYIIKSLIIETINNPHEGYTILDNIRIKEEIDDYKRKIDMEREIQ